MIASRPKGRPSRFERAYARKLRNNARADALFPEELPEEPRLLDIMRGRYVSILVGNARRAWRTCPVTRCRRARACIAPSFRCSNEKPDDPAVVRSDRISDIVRQTATLRVRFAREQAEQEQAEKDKAEKAARRKASAKPRAPGHG